ncbi:hypothetical protein QZH41_000193 [Actinostola sp. cb2023]|nr:hypothetical protein QZH41_000193 [Actinostola sp. cb2023]
MFNKSNNLKDNDNYHHFTIMASGMASVLDHSSMMPVVRARFRAPNGRIREGNILVDSGAGTTIIRKQFSKALGLQGTRERVNLAVVGGKKVEQPESRRVGFWISSLDSSEEFRIEAHELEQTVLDVPEIDRTRLRSFSHLRDLEFSHKAGPIDLILGVHYSHLHTETETRQGASSKEDEAWMVRYRIGWHAEHLYRLFYEFHEADRLREILPV